jgi:hypothetical protein
MATVKHSTAVLDGSGGIFTDRTILGMQLGLTNAAGGGAGLAVTTAVTFAEPLPASYTVLVQPNQDATAYVSSKTASGFNVVITPRLAATTLSAGTFDVIVLA